MDFIDKLDKWSQKIFKVSLLLRVGKFDDSDDASRLRRLKEISEQNKDHGKALEFNALELQGERHYDNNKSWHGLFLESCFRIFSNYGRSVFRPLLFLIVLWFVCGSVYCYFTGNIQSPLAFSARQMFPLIASLREADFSEVYQNFDWCIKIMMFFQSILAFMLIFLVGLALRNRFRL
ncbi:MAG: hypothetical protein HRT36_02420 [Alphaproteobacteria bacterium]|nr:hypothetical protein [Alphaproteobacteria bacterium]